MRLLRCFFLQTSSLKRIDGVDRLLCASLCGSYATRNYSHDSSPPRRSSFKWPTEHGYMPSTAPYQLFPLVATAEQARNIVAHMNDSERTLLSQQLKHFEDLKISAQAETTPSIVPPVTTQQLYAAFVYSGLPFVGFGILDNGIMIIAGEYIDVTIGVALGISTMAAAALGNLVSDVAGVWSTGYIEQFVSKLGVKVPQISADQARTRRVKWTVTIGRVLGITVGCLIGMLPLLLYNTESTDRKSDKK